MLFPFRTEEDELTSSVNLQISAPGLYLVLRDKSEPGEFPLAQLRQRLTGQGEALAVNHHAALARNHCRGAGLVCPP